MKSRHFKIFKALAGVSLVSLPWTAQADFKADKSSYWLFHATPESEMRELSTDRPDKTESPYTVDAGHFQIEADLMIISSDKTATETRTTTTSFFVPNLKVGLTNAIDLQAIVSPSVSQRIESPNGTSRTYGQGDTLIRVKFNIFGNDGGDAALGVMPFVQLPSHTNDLGSKRIEGGVIFPVAISLPANWDLGTMAQFNWAKNADDDHMHGEYIATLTVGHDIWGDIAGYLEFFSQHSDEKGADWVATFDTGLTYGATPNVQLDMGVNVGVTEAADDLNPFVGISARL
jgi:hypothetical protein